MRPIVHLCLMLLFVLFFPKLLRSPYNFPVQAKERRNTGIASSLASMFLYVRSFRYSTTNPFCGLFRAAYSPG